MQLWEDNLDLFLKGNCWHIFLLECMGRRKNQCVRCDTSCVHEWTCGKNICKQAVTVIFCQCWTSSMNYFSLVLLWYINLIKQLSLYSLCKIFKLFLLHYCFTVLAQLEQGHRDDLKMLGGFLALCFKWASQISTDQYNDRVRAQSCSLRWWNGSFLITCCCPQKSRL